MDTRTGYLGAGIISPLGMRFVSGEPHKGLPVSSGASNGASLHIKRVLPRTGAGVRTTIEVEGR